MKYSEATQGRVFVIRLEDGDILHECIEAFAREHSIRAASLILVGGADKGSTLVVGPEDGRAEDIVPMELRLDNVYEIAGTGTLFPDEQGQPVLHCHIAGGRENTAIAGCIRRGLKVWHVMELVLTELAECGGVRKLDPVTGFELLDPQGF